VFETRIGQKIAALGIAACCALPFSASAQDSGTIKMKQPTGWFGVRINDQMTFDEHGNAFFDSYPVVTAVDSGSPAARSGVRPGDVLMMFNSHDMRGGAVDLAKWLKAGAPFVLKVRRNDGTRVIRGTLGRRPDNWDPRLAVMLTVPQIMEQKTGSLSNIPPGRSSSGMVRVRGGRVPTPEPFTVLAPALGYGAPVYPFAGLEFTDLNSDLREALGVKSDGVFVTNVVDGSPARNAGLRGGDIILRANGTRISSPIDLVQAIKTADDVDRRLELQVMRQHRLKTLTLGW
jgi:S1-C subfamily serine protease